ncbi:hypothetical protein BOX15_Mlig004234g2 [Macrostomum lignano]|uniref:Uncharacterized protein n=1 Tax=Macrostomum lignano TaxID=282301 RepID=A0A267EIA6_9PLAT|nr:hypothetical protein BOX15_Mlig004234g2 [Macrostomum lignano]
MSGKKSRLAPLNFQLQNSLNDVAIDSPDVQQVDCKAVSNQAATLQLPPEVWHRIFSHVLFSFCHQLPRPQPQELQRLRLVSTDWCHLIDFTIASQSELWWPSVAKATLPRPQCLHQIDCREAAPESTLEPSSSLARLMLRSHRLAQRCHPVAMATTSYVHDLVAIPGVNRPITGLELFGRYQVVLAACLADYRGRLFAGAASDPCAADSPVELFDVAAFSPGCRTKLATGTRAIRLPAEGRQFLVAVLEASLTESRLDLIRVRLNNFQAKMELSRSLGYVARAWDLVDWQRLVACSAERLYCYRLVYRDGGDNADWPGTAVVDLEVAWHTLIEGVSLPSTCQIDSDALQWRLVTSGSSQLIVLITQDLQNRVWRLPTHRQLTAPARLTPRFGAALAETRARWPKIRLLSGCLASPFCLLLVTDWRRPAVLAIDLSTDTNGDISCRELPVSHLSPGEFCTAVAAYDGNCGCCSLVAMGFSTSRIRVYSVRQATYTAGSKSPPTSVSDIGAALLLGNESVIVTLTVTDSAQPISLLRIELTPDDVDESASTAHGTLSIAACTAGSSDCHLYRIRMAAR